MSGRIDRAECRRLRAEGWKLDDLSARYGVSRAAVSMACKGVVCGVDHDRERRARQRAKTEAAIGALLQAGHEPKAIAHLAGVHLSTVYRRLPTGPSPCA